MGRVLKFLSTNLLLVCLAAFISASSVFAQTDTRPVKRVLMCLTQHMSDIWTERMVNSIRKNTSNLPYRIEFTIIDFDVFRLGKSVDWHYKFLEYLPSIKRNYYSMIFAVDDVALDTVLDYYKEIPPDIPVVFAGYERYTPKLKMEYPNITGVTQNYDIEKTISQGLKFYPDTQKIFILYDNGKEGAEFVIRAKKVISSFSGIEVEYVNSCDYKIPDLFKKLGENTKKSIVLICPWRGLNDNDYQNIESFGLDLAKNCSLPFLVVTDTLIGYGALGGFGSIAYEDGKIAAKLIEKTLEAKSARNCRRRERNDLSDIRL